MKIYGLEPCCFRVKNVNGFSIKYLCIQIIQQKYTGSAVNTPSLTIYNAVQADEGYYICQATNAVGTGQSSQTYLDVVGSKYKTLCWVVMVVIVW
jgi:hypothetical protein